MSDYLKAYIPAKQSYGWSGGPEFKTNIVEKMNGRERRNADWANPRHRYTLSFQHLPKSVYAAVKGHHMVAMGCLRGFLFHDGMDDFAEDEVFATAAAGQTEFQLAKWSIVDGVPYQRKVCAIFLPSTNTPGVAIDSPFSATADGSPLSGTLDRLRGTLTTDPMSGGEVLRWTGGFSNWVRFDKDWMSFSYDQPDGIYGSIDMIEIPPPPIEPEP